MPERLRTRRPRRRTRGRRAAGRSGGGGHGATPGDLPSDVMDAGERDAAGRPRNALPAESQHRHADSGEDSGSSVIDAASTGAAKNAARKSASVSQESSGTDRRSKENSSRGLENGHGVSWTRLGPSGAS